MNAVRKSEQMELFKVVGPPRFRMDLMDVRWPVVEEYDLGRANSMELAHDPDGAWALGCYFNVHVAPETGSCGRGWGALPKWGVYLDRAAALAEARRSAVEFYREIGKGRALPAKDRAQQRAWMNLLDELGA